VDFNLDELVKEYQFNPAANGSIEIARFLIAKSALRGEVSDLLGITESDVLMEVNRVKERHDKMRISLEDSVRAQRKNDVCRN